MSDKKKDTWNVNCAEHNKRIIENKLQGVLKKMCRRLDISYEEWDIDKPLYMAMKKSKKFSTIKELAREYDSFYIVADGMKVTIEPKYKWFQNIHKKTEK